MNDLTLDPEEKDILESAENGEWQPIPNMREAIQRYQQYATESAGGQQEVTVHLPPNDLSLLQAKAREAGVSSETLIIGLVHNFVSR